MSKKNKIISLNLLVVLLLLSFNIMGCSNTETNEVNVLKDMDQLIDEEDWTESNVFFRNVQNSDGKLIKYRIIGKEETIGFSGSDPVAGRPLKWIWFYFGNEDILNKNISVRGQLKGMEESIDLHKGTFYKEAQVGEGYINMPSNIILPFEGLWKISIFVEDQLIENLVIKVPGP